MRRVLLMLALCPSACVFVPAGSDVQREKPADAVDIVGHLVSSNPPIRYVFDLPAGWSRQEDRRVWRAYEHIVREGRSIVPVLIANLDRPEFSTYVVLSVPYAPRTVGDMCHRALMDILDPICLCYKAREDKNGDWQYGEGFFDAFGSHPATVRRWWEANKAMSTTKIGADIRKWYVDRETRFGFKDNAQEARVLGDIETRWADWQAGRASQPTDGAGRVRFPVHREW